MVNLDLNQINYIEAANTKHPSRTEERGRGEIRDWSHGWNG